MAGDSLPRPRPSPGPRIRPLLEVLSAGVNGSPRAVSLDRITGVHDRVSLPMALTLPDVDHSREPLIRDSASRAPPRPRDGSGIADRHPGAGITIGAAHDRPFRSSSRSRSR